MDPIERGQQRRAARDQLLLELYHRLGGGSDSMLFASQLAEEIGWDEDALIDAAQELVERGHAEFPTTVPSLDLTPFGIEEAEQLILAGAGTAAARATVLQRQASRLAVLDYVYRATGARPNESIDFRDAAGAARTSTETELAAIAQWLVDRSLLTWGGLGGSIQMTRGGIDEMERAEAAPARPAAPGLASYNTIIIQGSTNVNVAQHSPGAHQVAGDVHETDVHALAALIDAIRAAVGDLPEAQRPRVVSYVEAIEQHIAADRAESTVITPLLREVYIIFRDTGVAVAGAIAAHLAMRGWTP